MYVTSPLSLAPSSFYQLRTWFQDTLLNMQRWNTCIEGLSVWSHELDHIPMLYVQNSSTFFVASNHLNIQPKLVGYTSSPTFGYIYT